MVVRAPSLGHWDGWVGAVVAVLDLGQCSSLVDQLSPLLDVVLRRASVDFQVIKAEVSERLDIARDT